MYKLLIVEDEAEVRNGIRNNIDWRSMGFKVIAEAGNGREALDIIENSKPDVVITDITMPIMDGLELSCILKKEYPTIRTIILTGYDDFKFAQRAIKYGVSDYLLKPVLPEDLSKLMLRIKNEIDSEIAEKEDIQKLRLYYQQSIPIIKDKFLTLLITVKNSIQSVISLSFTAVTIFALVFVSVTLNSVFSKTAHAQKAILNNLT